MSTAIVRIATTEGFAVAADGREYDIAKQVVICDSRQKIFAIEEPDRKLAYSLSGAVSLTRKGTSEVIFDFVPQINALVRALERARLKSLWHYANALTEGLMRRLEGITETVNEDEHPLVIFFDGFYEGRPKRAHVKIIPDQRQGPDVVSDELDYGQPVGIGSIKVLRALLHGKEPALLGSYRGPFADIRYRSTTLPHAVEIARNAVAAQCDPEALQIDPQCAGMGGRVHICTLTFKEGFRWVPGFEPSPPARNLTDWSER